MPPARGLLVTFWALAPAGGARCDETARRCEETARTSAAFIDEVDGEPMAVRLSGLLPGLPTSPRRSPTSRPRSPSSPWMPIIKRASSPGGGAVAWGRGGGVTVQQAKLRAFPEGRRAQLARRDQARPRVPATASDKRSRTEI